MTLAEESSEPNAPTVGRFHARLKQRPGEAFLAVRALAVNLGPDVVERVTESTVTYLRRDRPFLTVQAQKARLHLIFPPDVMLEDPTGRLLRRGDERYLALEGPEGVDGHTQEFVRKAYSGVR